MANKTKKASTANTDKKKKKKKQGHGGQLAQPGQAPQGGKSTFGSRDSVFMPNIKKAPPTKRYCNGKSKPFKRKKY